MRVNLFSNSQEGKSKTVSSQRMVNMFLELSSKPDRSPMALYPTPGLTLNISFGDTPVRGMHELGNFWYAVHRGTFWEINNAGVKTARGSITTTSGLISMADNGTQIMIVDGVAGWIYNISTLVFGQITDVDYPDDADTVEYADAFFLVNNPANPGRWYKSATFNGLNWDPLDFATAEYSSDPLARIMNHQGYVGLFGRRTTEAWQNIGQLNFPYQRVSGAVLEWGLTAKHSLVKYGQSVIFLARNRLGGQQIVLSEGMVPNVISGPDMEAELASYDSLADAVAFSYTLQGHSFYHISFPSDGESWIYNLTTDNWAEVRSGSGLHRAQLGITYLNKFLVSDYENGQVYYLDPDALSDNGALIERELITHHKFSKGRESVASLWLDVQPGTGTPVTPDPHVVLTVSRDGGNTYGPGLPAPIGSTGEFLKRCRWSRLGKARDWVFKFRLTEIANWVVTGAWMQSSA